MFLCRMDKMKQKTEKNWPRKHAKYINEFEQKIASIEYKMEHGGLSVERPHDDAAFNEYLVWLSANTRLKLNAPAFVSSDILDQPNPGFDHLANIEYNRLIRGGRRQELAPIVNFVVSYYVIYPYYHIFIS